MWANSNPLTSHYLRQLFFLGRQKSVHELVANDQISSLQGKFSCLLSKILVFSTIYLCNPLDINKHYYDWSHINKFTTWASIRNHWSVAKDSLCLARKWKNSHSWTGQTLNMLVNDNALNEICGQVCIYRKLTKLPSCADLKTRGKKQRRLLFPSRPALLHTSQFH